MLKENNSETYLNKYFKQLQLSHVSLIPRKEIVK